MKEKSQISKNPGQVFTGSKTWDWAFAKNMQVYASV
jgi:hypothetical protein